MARNSVSIYQFADFNYDEFLKQFLFEISEHTTEDWSQPQINLDDTLSPCGIIYHKAKRGVKKPDIIRCNDQFDERESVPIHIFTPRARKSSTLRGSTPEI